jgi:ribulose 1,5-bisphosphate synthetase/thiazole synthase
MSNRFNGHVDPQFITTSATVDATGRKVNTITIAVGKLPGIKAKKLWANKKIKMTLTIYRSLGSNRLSQALNVERKRE